MLSSEVIKVGQNYMYDTSGWGGVGWLFVCCDGGLLIVRSWQLRT